MIFPENRNRSELFDFLKGIAILGIVAIHATIFFPFQISQFINDVSVFGQYNVQLFFIITAFLTFKSFEKNPHNFLLRKFIALLPICYCAYFLNFIIKIISNENISIQGLLLSFTFTNGLSTSYYNYLDNWYIGTICLFYIITPILFRFIKSTEKAFWFFAISLIICILSTEILALKFYTGKTFYFWLPRQLPVLALGILLFFSIKEKQLSSYKTILLLFISIFALHYSSLNLIHNQLHIIYAAIYFFITFYFANLTNTKSLGGGVLELLGKNTLGIYLTHFTIFKILAVIFRPLPITNQLLSNIIFILFIIADITLAYIVTSIIRKFIEKPCLKYFELIFPD